MEPKFKVGDLIQWEEWTYLIKRIETNKFGYVYILYDLKTGQVGQLGQHHTELLYTLAGQ